MPLPLGQPALQRAVGAGPLLSMPGFCVTLVRHSRQHSARDGDVVEQRRIWYSKFDLKRPLQWMAHKPSPYCLAPSLDFRFQAFANTSPIHEFLA